LFEDSNNIFNFEPDRGIIKQKSTARIIVHFRPRHTICYYERVYYVVKNHKIFSLDLLGTCYDLLIKPLKLEQKHINIFRKRVILGKLTEIDFKYMENAAILKL